MRRILQFGILAALGAIFSVASAQASVLWWETNDPEDIEVENGDGTTTTAAALGVTDVRIRVSGGDAGDNSYLQMAYFDPNTGGLTIGNTPGTTVVEVPTYDVYAYLGPDGYNYDNAAYSFTIELGNWSDGTWTVLAESDLANYSELAGHIAPGGGGLDVPYALPWNPQHYVVPVPEPGSALLIVIGCAVLALRRRPAV